MAHAISLMTLRVAAIQPCLDLKPDYTWDVVCLGTRLIQSILITTLQIILLKNREITFSTNATKNNAHPNANLHSFCSHRI